MQNAWSPLWAGGRWPRDRWLIALEKSRSGKRLARLIGCPPTEKSEYWFDNTTPIVGATPDSVVPIDRSHIDRLLAIPPDAIIACGKQAEAAVAAWSGPLLLLPHPAYRLLSDLTLDAARTILETGIPRRCRVAPTRDKRVEVTDLESGSVLRCA
jgi:hypothetical protein